MGGLGSYRALCVTIRAGDTERHFLWKKRNSGLLVKHSGLLIASQVVLNQ